MGFEKGFLCSRMLFMDQGALTYMHDCAPVESNGARYEYEMEMERAQLMEERRASVSVQPGESVRKGMALSEAALWVEWINQGRLSAESNSVTLLVALEAGAFLGVLQDQSVAYGLAVVYARKFLE